MPQLRNRITYANVMSTIAVFLVLGGATAFAASKLGKNSVGTKQLKAGSVTAAKLKKNSVTEKKVRKNAITTSKVKDGAIATAKIQDGAVTGAKVQTATLGTVPSAATLSGYGRKGIVRVAASPAGIDFLASRAASPEIPLLATGPFSLYAKCFNDGDSTEAGVYIKTSENGSIADSMFITLEGDPGLLNTNTPEEERELMLEGTEGPDRARYFGVHTTEFTAMAPGGTVIRGDAQIAVKNGNLPGGNGIYGNGNVCLFAAEMTALSG
jgi:hypothetical protein